MRSNNGQKEIAIIEALVQTNFVKHLMNNPGHSVAYNEEQYLKNDSWNRSRYNKAKKAIKVLKDVLSY